MGQGSLFDPSRIKVPPEERLGGGEQPRLLTPRAVNDLVSGILAAHLPPTLHVLGEVGQLSRPQSGHLYFSLKDAASELRCVMWRSAASRLPFTLEPGMEVIASGALEVYKPRGTYQLIVRKLEPRGVGALEVAFRQLKEKLAREGLFDKARKRPLPPVPLRIGVVTSPSGAAIRDIVRTLGRRFPPAEVLLFPVRVQGEGAAEEIAHAIRDMNRCAAALGGIDVAIVGRGGGSLEDLWAFNEEVVARAIAASRIPIISAVGHEVDVTIADLVADLRAATPTAAAELAAPSVDELLETLSAACQRAGRALRHAFELSASRLAQLLAAEPLARPLRLVHEAAQRTDEAQRALDEAVASRLRQARAALDAQELRLVRFAGGARFAELRRRVEQIAHRAGQCAWQRVRVCENELTAADLRVQRRLPERLLARYDERLEHTIDKVRRLVDGRRQAAAELLAGLEGRLHAAHPRRIVERGFSITRDARSGRVIRSVEQVRPGQRVVSEVADGQFESRVEDGSQGQLFE